MALHDDLWFSAPEARLAQPSALQLRAVSGRRALSELYELTLTLRYQAEHALDDEELDALITRPVAVGFERGVDEIHGVLRQVSMVGIPSEDRDSAWQYRAVLVPRLWRLSRTRRSRVFQDQTHLEIVEAVLTEHGVPFESSCNARYPAREYTVQYEESDLALVSRLLEHHGIHFRFEHTPDGEVVMLGDDNRAFEREPETLHMHLGAETGQLDSRPTIQRLEHVRAPGPQRVVVRDYDWRRPTQALRYEAPADDVTGVGVCDEYGSHLREDAEGERIAAIRAEEAIVGCDRIEGVTAWVEMTPGTRFVLVDHPNPSLAREYVAMAIEDDLGYGDAGLARRFVAIPYERTFRPSRKTPRPRVPGLVNAKVDGEHRSHATPLDPEGRYRVVIPFDLNGRGGGRASRWIRRAQPSAGVNSGFHFPLHIGTEVAVGHVNGDPDRPVIVGAVPNVETRSPVGSDNATQHRFVTPSGAVMEWDEDCG